MLDTSAFAFSFAKTAKDVKLRRTSDTGYSMNYEPKTISVFFLKAPHPNQAAKPSPARIITSKLLWGQDCIQAIYLPSIHPS
jgi:hypothetical protein